MSVNDVRRLMLDVSKAHLLWTAMGVCDLRHINFVTCTYFFRAWF